MKLKNIYTYGGKPEQRNFTVADLVSLKGKVTLSQTCPNDKSEAVACVEAGIDVINCTDVNLRAVREGAPNTVCIADLPMTSYFTPDEILRAAVTAAEIGADIIYTPRSLKIVEMLAREGLAVQGHAGLVPRRSTKLGGLRSIGKTAEEAMQVVMELRQLEDAGAQFVEVECVPSEILKVVNCKTQLVTHSIGAGSSGDVIFMFLVDICGDAETRPAHAKAFGNVKNILDKLQEERVHALTAFVQSVKEKSYPDASNTTSMLPGERDKFLEAIDRVQPFHR